MKNERMTITCSNCFFPRRQYLDDEGRETRGIFVICERDWGYCIPSKFERGCPNGRGTKVDLELVRSGQVYDVLGKVTIPLVVYGERLG